MQCVCPVTCMLKPGYWSKSVCSFDECDCKKNYSQVKSRIQHTLLCVLDLFSMMSLIVVMLFKGGLVVQLWQFYITCLVTLILFMHLNCLIKVCNATNVPHNSSHMFSITYVFRLSNIMDRYSSSMAEGEFLCHIFFDFWDTPFCNITPIILGYHKNISYASWNGPCHTWSMAWRITTYSVSCGNTKFHNQLLTGSSSLRYFK